MTLASRFELSRPELYGKDGRIELLGEPAPASAEHLIISCMDLRVSLHALFGFQPGEMLNLRSAGAIIPPFKDSCTETQILHENLQLAIADMHIKTISILGHTKCGTAKKLSQNLYCSGDIPWMKKISERILQSAIMEADQGNQEEITRAIEKNIIIQSIKNLFDYPIIEKSIRNGELTVEGLQFDVKTGRLFKLNTDGRSFSFDIVAGPLQGSLECDCEDHKQAISAQA